MIKKRIINFILIIFIIICLCLLVYSGYQIYLWHHSNVEIDEQVKKVEEKVDVKPVEDNPKTEIINPER